MAKVETKVEPNGKCRFCEEKRTVVRFSFPSRMWPDRCHEAVLCEECLAESILTLQAKGEDVAAREAALELLREHEARAEQLDITTLSDEALQSLIAACQTELKARQQRQNLTVRVDREALDRGEDRGKSWSKVVESVDSTKSNGYAYEGRWTSRSDFEAKEGTVILSFGHQYVDCTHSSTEWARLFIVDASHEDGIVLAAEARGRNWALDLRDRAAELLAGGSR